MSTWSHSASKQDVYEDKLQLHWPGVLVRRLDDEGAFPLVVYHPDHPKWIIVVMARNQGGEHSDPSAGSPYCQFPCWKGRNVFVMEADHPKGIWDRRGGEWRTLYVAGAFTGRGWEAELDEVVRLQVRALAKRARQLQ